MNSVVPGLYRHFKGGMYRVLGVAYDAETQEESVIYQALHHSAGYPNHALWHRPIANWGERVDRGDYHGPRFVFVSENGPFVCEDCGASVL